MPDNRFALACERAVLQRARRVKRSARFLRFEAFWRGGEGANVSLNLDNGWWYDFVTGESGGAQRLAELLNVSMRDFMQGIIGEERFEQEPEPEREGIADAWEWLLAASEGETESALWLEEVRGVPSDRCDSGFAHVDALTIRAVGDDELHKYLAWHVMSYGPLIAAPLRDALTGEIRNMQLRPLDGGERHWIRGCFLQGRETRAPRGYGFCHRARHAGVVVVFEGFVDTLIGEIALRDRLDTCAVGLSSSSTALHWANTLATSKARRIVLVPQLDPPAKEPGKPGEQSQKAMASLAAALERMDAPAEFFDWDGFLERAGVTGAKDPGDVCRAVGFDRTKDALTATLGA